MPKRKAGGQPRSQPKPKRQRTGVVRGAGAYDFKRAIAPSIGGLAGLALGGIPGMAAGVGVGGAFNKVAGLGSYSIQRSATVDQVPVMHATSTNVRIRHREYIQDLSSSTAFALTSLYVNPGIAATFPWLSNIAANFETYRFRGLMFVFKSTSADALNSTNTALGTVVMSADYNATTPVPLSKAQMEQAMWAVSGKPSESIMAPIECARQETALTTMYIRNAGQASGADLRFTDLCRLDIATVGSQASATIGELWVTYEVELSKPILNYGAPSTVYSAHYAATAGIANATPLGTQVLKYDNMSMSISSTVITFAAQVTGTFIIAINWSGGAVVGASPGVTFANCTGKALINNSSSSSAFSTGGTTAQAYVIMVTVPLSASPSTVTLGTGGTICTTNCDINISQLNSADV